VYYFVATAPVEKRMKDSGFEVADDGRLIIPEEEGSLKKPGKSSGLYHPHVLLYFCFVKVNATYFFMNVLGLSILSEDTEMESSLKVNVGFLFHCGLLVC
jgi:hypothetical protein